jgi:translation initiation factor 3 subunit C
MSRFLRTADPSDSSSSSESESESEDEPDEEESDEEVKRVVKSARDKRLEDMEATGKAIDNALKINDWIAISTGQHHFLVPLSGAAYVCCHLEYDKLARMVQRQQNVAEPIPPFYIRTLISLEAALNAALAKEKEAKKKMNASNARALTAMKQRVRKTVKEYEKEIKQYNDVNIPCKHPALFSADCCQDPEAFEQEYAALAVPQVQARPEVVRKSAGVEGEDEDDFTQVGKGGKPTQYTSEGIYKTLQAIQEARGKKVSSRFSPIPTLCRHLSEYRPCGSNSYTGAALRGRGHAISTNSCSTCLGLITLRLQRFHRLLYAH